MLRRAAPVTACSAFTPRASPRPVPHRGPAVLNSLTTESRLHRIAILEFGLNDELFPWPNITGLQTGFNP